MNVLKERLQEDKKFTKGTTYYDFVSLHPERWKNAYQQSKAIKGGCLWDGITGQLDAQEIALGACMLYGLSSGIIEYISENTYLRFGRVTSIAGGKARVELPDGQKTVFYDLSTVQSRAPRDQDIKTRDVGEPVACLCSGQGSKRGVSRITTARKTIPASLRLSTLFMALTEQRRLTTTPIKS